MACPALLIKDGWSHGVKGGLLVCGFHSVNGSSATYYELRSNGSKDLGYVEIRGPKANNGENPTIPKVIAPTEAKPTPAEKSEAWQVAHPAE